MKKHYRHENDCLNCGTVLDGKFCHNCGQENLQIKENFGHLMNHAVSDYFHFDHQFFHTLKPLLFKPGKLTNEYMAGRRVQYLHPIKMYIFISLIFFLLYFKHSNVTEEPVRNVKKPVNKEAVDSARRVIAANPMLSKETKNTLNKMVSKGMAVNIDTDGNIEQENTESYSMDQTITDTKDSTYAQYLARQDKLPSEQKDGYFKRVLEKKKFDYKKHGGSAKELMMEEFKHNVPKMMFILLPLFALILRFTFWQNKKFYVEHLIFSFHLHCFLFLFLTVAMLLKIFIPEAWELNGCIDTVVTIGSIVYIFQALRAVYHRSKTRTALKMIGMSFSYSIAVTVCLLLVFVITAMTAA